MTDLYHVELCDAVLVDRHGQTDAVLLDQHGDTDAAQQLVATDDTCSVATTRYQGD